MKYRIEERADEHTFYAEREASPGIWDILGECRTHDEAEAVINLDEKKGGKNGRSGKSDGDLSAGQRLV